jgi:hypothetical protein
MRVCVCVYKIAHARLQSHTQWPHTQAPTHTPLSSSRASAIRANCRGCAKPPVVKSCTHIRTQNVHTHQTRVHALHTHQCGRTHRLLLCIDHTRMQKHTLKSHTHTHTHTHTHLLPCGLVWLVCVVQKAAQVVATDRTHTEELHTRTHAHTRTHTHVRAVCGVMVDFAMRLGVHTHKHTYTYACMHSNLHAHIHRHIHRYIRTHIHTYIHTYTHTYIHTHVRTYVRTRVPTRARVGCVRRWACVW